MEEVDDGVSSEDTGHRLSSVILAGDAVFNLQIRRFRFIRLTFLDSTVFWYLSFVSVRAM